MTIAVAPEPVPLETDADGVVRVGGSRVTLDTLVAAFRTGDSPEEFAAINEWAATPYQGMPGLIGKIVHADPDDGHAYGGVYLWETRDDAERYLHGELIRSLADDPRVVDVQARILAVLAGPTSITGGPIADLVTHRTG